MTIFHKRLLVLTALVTAPLSAFAAVPMGFDGLDNLIKSIATGVVQSTGYMLLTLAVVAFFWGIVQFIFNARQGSEGKGIQKGKQFIVWGLIGIFVMFSIWGIIQFAQGVLGIQGYNTITVPSLNFNRAGSTGTGTGTGTYTQTQTTAAQAYATCINSGRTVAQCESAYQTAGGTGGAYTATQTNAQQAYNNCIANSGTATSCQTAYQAAGGVGSGQQNLAQQAYNSCIGNGNTAAECAPAYRAYGGTGDPQQNLAQQAYNECIGNGNGNTVSECQAAYAAYGGNGSGAANLGQQAYDLCTSNGGSATQCNAARDAYTGASSGCDSIASEVARDACYAAGANTGGGTAGSCPYTSADRCADWYAGQSGGSTTTSCDAGWHATSDGSGCVPDDGQSGSVTTQSCGAQGLEPNADNSACVSSSGGDYGPTIDYGSDDWQTVGDGAGTGFETNPGGSTEPSCLEYDEDGNVVDCSALFQ